MGIETSAEHGGAESSFTSAIITIEELAKVDPSVSVMCDVHNTLVNTVIRKYGTSEQQEKWLPQLSTSKVRRQMLAYKFALSLTITTHSLVAFACPRRRPVRMRLPSRRVQEKTEITGLSMAPRCGSQTRMRLKYFSSLPTQVLRRYVCVRILLSIAWQIDPSKGYKGITCFLATKDMGVQIAKKEQKLGIRASSTCTLNFDDLKVPAENVIGEEGQGYKIAIEILNEGLARLPIHSCLFSLQRDRSYWYRSTDAWPRSGSVRQSGSHDVRAQAVWAGSGHVPGHGFPNCTGCRRPRDCTATSLQCHAEKGGRTQLRQRGGHGEVLDERRGTTCIRAGDRMGRRPRFHAGDWH